MHIDALHETFKIADTQNSYKNTNEIRERYLILSHAVHPLIAFKRVLQSTS